MWKERLRAIGWSRLALAVFLILFGLVGILDVENVILWSLVPLAAIVAGILLLVEKWPSRSP